MARLLDDATVVMFPSSFRGTPDAESLGCMRSSDEVSRTTRRIASSTAVMYTPTWSLPYPGSFNHGTWSISDI